MSRTEPKHPLKKKKKQEQLNAHLGISGSFFGLKRLGRRCLYGRWVHLEPDAATGFHSFRMVFCLLCHNWVELAGPAVRLLRNQRVPSAALNRGESAYMLGVSGSRESRSSDCRGQGRRFTQLIRGNQGGQLQSRAPGPSQAMPLTIFGVPRPPCLPHGRRMHLNLHSSKP